MTWVQIDLLMGSLFSLMIIMWGMLIFICLGIWSIWRVVRDMFPPFGFTPPNTPDWADFRGPTWEPMTPIQETVDPLILDSPPSYHSREDGSSYDNETYVSITSSDTSSDDDTLGVSSIDWSVDSETGESLTFTLPQVSSYQGTGTSDPGTI